jgi:cysteine desulfurase family protein (TIGR01976 family)
MTTSSLAIDTAEVRRRFSSLSRGFHFFDSPGGSQAPDSVAEAIARTVRDASANLGAPYETSRRVGAILEQAEQSAARFLGCSPGEITFGLNMTTLNFALSRTAGRHWQSGDELIVTALDHDANVAPWLALAADKDLTVHTVRCNDDTTLDLDDLRSKLSSRTRVLAFTWASNAVGTITQAREICALAHEAGALAWIDAVHYAAHEPIDVVEAGADVLLCSPYKFCGPHLGIAFASERVARDWDAYKTRPTPELPTGRRLATGTFPFESLAGLIACFEHLQEVGGMAAICDYERTLGEQLLAGLPDSATLYGLPGLDGRVPTLLLNLDRMPAREVSRALAERGFGVWSGDTWYSLGLYERLGYEGEALRIGIAHYNDASEVDALLEALASLA